MGSVALINFLPILVHTNNMRAHACPFTSLVCKKAHHFVQNHTLVHDARDPFPFHLNRSLRKHTKGYVWCGDKEKALVAKQPIENIIIAPLGIGGNLSIGSGPRALPECPSLSFA